jgi:hypothetical protein
MRANSETFGHGDIGAPPLSRRASSHAAFSSSSSYLGRPPHIPTVNVLSRERSLRTPGGRIGSHASEKGELASRMASYNLSPTVISLMLSASAKERSATMKRLPGDQRERLLAQLRALPEDLQREVQEWPSDARGSGSAPGIDWEAAATPTSPGATRGSSSSVQHPPSRPATQPQHPVAYPVTTAPRGAIGRDLRVDDVSTSSGVLPPPRASEDVWTSTLTPSSETAQASRLANPAIGITGAGGGGSYRGGDFVVRRKGNTPVDGRQYKVIRHLTEVGKVTRKEDEDTVRKNASLALLKRAKYVPPFVSLNLPVSFRS